MNNPAYDRDWLQKMHPQHTMLGPCAKQQVSATITTPTGETFTGTNSCRRPQPACPRDAAGMKTGQGYHLCIEVCQQTGHAEINALRLAGDKAKGATMDIEGHTYACAECVRQATAAGIADLVVGGGFKRLNEASCGCVGACRYVNTQGPRPAYCAKRTETAACGCAPSQQCPVHFEDSMK